MSKCLWVEKQGVSTQVDVTAILTAITHGRQRAEAAHRELEGGELRALPPGEKQNPTSTLRC